MLPERARAQLRADLRLCHCPPAQKAYLQYNIPMRMVELLMLITGILWAVASIYFIYLLGVGILTLKLQPIIEGGLIFLFATAAAMVVAILNE